MLLLVRNYKHSLPNGLNHKIESFSKLSSTPITLLELLKTGEQPINAQKLINSAQFVSKELPIRLAKRMKSIHQLPFIVGVNPFIKSVYNLYQDSFVRITSFRPILTDTDELEFTDMLRELVRSHQDVIPKLARGMSECNRYMSKQEITWFLDKMIQERIGIRVIAEHHLALHETIEGYSGILNHRLSPFVISKKCSKLVHELCELNYGSSPEVKFDGDLDTRFPYIDVHLEYMLMELLKNSFRATVEYSKKSMRAHHPDLVITIGEGKEDVTIRIRDQGGGITSQLFEHILEYSFTTVKQDYSNSGVLSAASQLAVDIGTGGAMAGLGYGLPMTRIYAKWAGGSLDLVSIDGYGCDVFLRIPHIGQITTSLKI